MALVTPGTNQTQGEVYAMNFVYSGNFIAQVERNEFDYVRMTMGIHPEGFCWKLEPGEYFVAPEVVNVYSANGLEAMTHTFHHLYRKHLIRSPYLHKERPILINNWEATYFDFDEKKSIKINETDKKFDKAKLANLALEQIEHKEYYQDHLDYSSVLKIYCFGICFCKKSCSVAFKEIKK